MERIGVLAAILLVLVVARVSDASSRVLMADGRGDGKHDTGKVSPSPTPNPSPETNVSKSSHQFPSPVTNSTAGGPKTSSTSGNSANLAPPSGLEKNKNGGSEGLTKPGSPTDRSQVYSCHASSEECHIGELIACLQHPQNDSKVLLLLVHNTGKNNMTVKIEVTPPIKINVEEIQITKGNITEIPINAMKSLEIVLRAGNDNCTLHTKAGSFDWNLPQWLPSYASHLTPIYGAYFLFVTIVICGGTWACCKLRRGRRADTRIPYRQLEMGTLTESTSAVVDLNTADDWDEGWDEDWDEEEAAPRPSEKHTTGSVSVNGLTSRSPRKDGWDVDWDD